MGSTTRIRQNTVPDPRTYFKEVFTVLCHLTSDEKELVARHSTCTAYRQGEMIYRQGDKPSGLICLLHGKVKVYKEGISGRDSIARLVKPVEMVGYRALFAEEFYKASAQAIESSVICTVERETLFRVLRRNPSLMFSMMKLLAQELGFVNSRTISLTQKHIRGRLADTLLLLKDTYGYEADKQTIKVYLSREDLANLSNMTASNAIRTLSLFSAEGILGLDGRKIKIYDDSLLKQISESKCRESSQEDQ